MNNNTSHATTKYSRSFIITDKENHAQVSNTSELPQSIQTALNNSQSQKLKKNFIPVKSGPLAGFNDCKPTTEQPNSSTLQSNPSTTSSSALSGATTTQNLIINSHSNAYNNPLANYTITGPVNPSSSSSSSNSTSSSNIAHSKTEENLREIAQKLNADKVQRNLISDLPDEPAAAPSQEMNPKSRTSLLPVGNPSSIGGTSTTSSTSCINNPGQIVSNQVQAPAQPKEIADQRDDQFQVQEWNPNKEVQYSFKDAENQNLIQQFSTTIIEYMKKKEKDTTPYEALKHHNIPTNLRAKMIDWMIEVLSSYKCTEQTFFLAVRIMDLYFQKSTKVHEVSDLHLVGVTSMFIACQYEEIYPMKLQVVYEKIAHKKLPIDAIKQKESEILQTILFNLIGATPYEITSHILLRCNLKEILEPKVFNYLQKICIYLSKMILYDYELICLKDYSLLSASLIYVAYQIIEQIDSGFVAVEKIKDVMKILTISNDPLIQTAAKILNLAKNFDKLFPNLENLQKFNVFSLEDSEKKK